MNNKMNNKIFLLISLISLLVVAGCSVNNKTPKIELNQYSYDMGDVVLEKGLKEHTFTITNSGNDLLNISYISTSCGCTTAEVENKEILPGQSTQLKVIYDPAIHPNLRGKLERIVYIQSNDPLNEEIELEITGNQISSKEPRENVETVEHDDNLKDFEVSPHFTNERIKSDEVKLLDVRELFEYKENHIEGSLLLSVNNITQESLDNLGLKKDDEIIIYCRSGKRSARAYKIMKDLGYINIKSMGGGIIHWINEEFPVESGISTKNFNGENNESN